MLGFKGIPTLSTTTKLFILASVWASFISYGIVGLYAGRYNTDPHLAINLARYYLHRSDRLAPLFDIGTHGFIHALLYLPFIHLLEFFRVPFSAQDGIAIGCIYGLSAGLIAILTYAVSRHYHDKFISSLISVIIVASLLVHPGELDFISPNAELIGSVLLLLYWSILLYHYRLPRPFWLAIIVGILTFHLKYQLIPQLFALSFVSGLKPRQAWATISSIFILSLVVDLLAYRLENNSGILLRFAPLFSGYVFTSNPEYPGLAKSAALLLPSIVLYYPLFIIAWAFFFDRMVLSRRRKSNSASKLRSHLLSCALLSVVTLIAIVLPGKNFAHYYILLLPTTVMVLNHALLGFQSNTNDETGLPSPTFSFFKHVRYESIVFSLLPFVLSSLILSALSFLFRGNERWQSTTLMRDSERRQGALLYGWTSGYSYGSFGTYPFDPTMDMGLMGVKFSMNHDAYNQQMNMVTKKPPYIIDLAAAGNNEILGRLIKPLEILKRQPGSDWSKSYQLVRRNKAGWLYKLMD